MLETTELLISVLVQEKVLSTGTGVWANEKGFSWDRVLVQSTHSLTAQYRGHVGGHQVGLLDGTQYEDWASGEVSSVELVGYARTPNPFELIPQVSVGQYGFKWESRNLFSDYSVTDKFSIQSINPSMLVELNENAVWSTIQIAIWNRQGDSTVHRYRRYQFVETFTGYLDELDGTRLVATDDTGVLWNNLETRMNEFTILDGFVYLNKTDIVTVGTSDVPTTDTAPLFEDKGLGGPYRKVLYCNYLPVEPGTLRVFVLDGVFEEWTEVDNIYHSLPGEKVFQVDHDLGYVIFGGIEQSSLTLTVAINELQETINCIGTFESITAYPESGILTIEAEDIFYQSRDEYGFYGCSRGYNGSTGASHNTSALVTMAGGGAATTTSQRLYLAYTAVPRIEYEVTDAKVRTANSYSWLSVSPDTNNITNKILCISCKDKDLTSIVLTTDRTFISGNLFGPMFFGIDTARLTTTCLDSYEQGVSELEATIDLLTPIGTINSNKTSYVGTTNGEGQLFANYQAPFSTASVEFPVVSVAQVGFNTEFTISGITEGTIASEIIVYQILKHDRSNGYTGIVSAVEAAANVVLARHRSYIDVKGVYDDTYRGGYCYVTGTDLVDYYRVISGVEQIVSSGERLSRIYFTTTIQYILFPAGQPVRIFGPEEVEWNSSTLNGTRVILYQWSTSYQHPLTGIAGAYGPVVPDRIEGNRLIFENRTLPVPAPSDITNNLGGYVVILPRIVSLQARATDPVTGNQIFSNIVRLLIEVPGYMKGVATTGALPIPYGWKFPTEEFNVGSGLGGTNFITINPRTDTYNGFTVKLS